MVFDSYSSSCGGAVCPLIYGFGGGLGLSLEGFCFSWSLLDGGTTPLSGREEATGTLWAGGCSSAYLTSGSFVGLSYASRNADSWLTGFVVGRTHPPIDRLDTIRWRSVSLENALTVDFSGPFSLFVPVVVTQHP